MRQAQVSPVSPYDQVHSLTSIMLYCGTSLSFRPCLSHLTNRDSQSTPFLPYSMSSTQEALPYPITGGSTYNALTSCKELRTIVPQKDRVRTVLILHSQWGIVTPPPVYDKNMTQKRSTPRRPGSSTRCRNSWKYLFAHPERTRQYTEPQSRLGYPGERFRADRKDYSQPSLKTTTHALG